MLNRADKGVIIQDLKASIDKAQAVFLTNLVGIEANQSVELRKNVRESDGKIVVTRNTLFKIAAEGTSIAPMVENLKGPHALAFAFDDAAAVAKHLKNAGDDLDAVELKGGVLNGAALSLAQVLELADLPSRDEMLGTLLATFNAPISAFARVMNSIKEQKESGAEVAVEAAAPEETVASEAAPVASEAAAADESKK